jgi:hypothetical protein
LSWRDTVCPCHLNSAINCVYALLILFALAKLLSWFRLFFINGLAKCKRGYHLTMTAMTASSAFYVWPIVVTFALHAAFH